MMTRVIEVMAWHPQVPGSDRHVSGIRAVRPGASPSPDLGFAGKWTDGALCAEVDPELFFPGKGGSSAPAVRICASCEVRALCLEDALASGDRHGVRGGLTGKERAALGIPVTRPPAVVCSSGRHLVASGDACRECESARERERELTRVRDQAAIYARRVARAAEARAA